MAGNRAFSENEKKKDFLNSYLKAKKAVLRLEQQLEELEIGKISPSSKIGDGMPHSHNKTDLSDYAVALERVNQDIITAKYKKVTIFVKVRKSIEELKSEEEKDVLTYRYIKGCKWESICVKMNYSWRQIHYIHARALEHIEIIA